MLRVRSQLATEWPSVRCSRGLGRTDSFRRAGLLPPAVCHYGALFPRRICRRGGADEAAFGRVVLSATSGSTIHIRYTLT